MSSLYQSERSANLSVKKSLRVKKPKRTKSMSHSPDLAVRLAAALRKKLEVMGAKVARRETGVSLHSSERKSSHKKLKKKSKLTVNHTPHIEGHTSSLAVKFAAALRRKMEKMTGVDLSEDAKAKRNKFKSKTSTIDIEGHPSELTRKLGTALKKKVETMAGSSAEKLRLKRATERLKGKSQAFRSSLSIRQASKVNSTSNVFSNTRELPTNQN